MDNGIIKTGRYYLAARNNLQIVTVQRFRFGRLALAIIAALYGKGQTAEDEVL